MSDLKTDLEWTLAIHFSGNRMPHMSGDPRNRLSPGQRQRMDDVVQSIMEIVQQREQAARREGMEEAARIVETDQWARKPKHIAAAIRAAAREVRGE